MSFKTLYNKIVQKANTVSSNLEAHIYRMGMRYTGISSIFIKLLINVMIIISALIPFWIGFITYALTMWLAGVLGIAVMATKIIVFILLLIILGKLQFAFSLLGITAIIFVILA